MQGWLLWVAQGFGLGRLPLAPGTFGSLVGVLWFALLLRTGNFWAYLAGTLAGTGLSIWLCGLAEETLRQHDPGSVVLDEIAAVPVCFLGFVALARFHHGHFPELDAFFSSDTWYITLIVFLMFRLFDVVKPWPVRQSQSLPGGWGVTIDDVLAGIYVALLSLLSLLFR